MSKTYHVLNDYSLEELTPEEAAQFSQTVSRLSSRKATVNGFPATYHYNAHRELIYTEVESDTDLNDYELKTGSAV